GSIEAGLKRRIGLRRRKDIWFAINCSATCKDNALDFIDSHCLQDVPGGNGILFEVDPCLSYAPANVSIRLKVEHKIAACHFPRESLAIKNVGAHYPDLGVSGV